MDMRPTEFGTADAKARFSELLARVETGETITIRRHGRAVAQLVPVPAPMSPEERRRAHEKWVAYRKAHDITLGPGLTISQLLDESRHS